mmetsp:Transcript_26751/g.90026  ORF Transcript_26751/g.90026 Transcript_26751/m.90026 type:complete len:362 (+) Transcript_26751:303-1388(+)
MRAGVARSSTSAGARAPTDVWICSSASFEEPTFYRASRDVASQQEPTRRKLKVVRVESDCSPGVVKSCVSVTAWPPLLYKNYTALLAHFHVETVPMPLSWFLNSKVPGFEGTLWAATHGQQAGPNLRDVFARDFSKYAAVEKFAGQCTSLFTLAWAPWKRGDTMSMYTNHTGLGMLNPLNVVPLYTLCRAVGVTEAWWDIVFTPHYTASFLVDELRPFPAVFAPIIEAQIPLLPTAQNSWQGASSRSAHDCNITTSGKPRKGHGIVCAKRGADLAMSLTLPRRISKTAQRSRRDGPSEETPEKMQKRAEKLDCRKNDGPNGIDYAIETALRSSKKTRRDGGLPDWTSSRQGTLKLGFEMLF